MSAPGSIVVLGAGYGGALGAIRLARHGLDVTLVSASERFCERIRLHQLAAGERLRSLSVEALLGDCGARFVQAEVSGIDLAARRLATRAGEGIAFDQLVLATGSESDREGVPGAREHAPGIGDPQDAGRLAGELDALAASGGRVLIVGGGLSGIELAAELAEARPSLAITLASASDPGAAFTRRAGRHLRKRFADLGIDVRSGVRVREVERGEARLMGGERLAFDRCIWAGSFRPGPLAREAGLAVDARGGAWLDGQLRSRSHPFVSVVGDAGVVYKGAGRASAMSCQLAMPMGAYVADRLAAEGGGRNASAGARPSPDFRFRALLRCVSLGRGDGIVQALRADESPARLAVVGRRAAGIKEKICRYTVQSLERERRGSTYRWLGGRVANGDPSAAEGHAHGHLGRALRS